MRKATQLQFKQKKSSLFRFFPDVLIKNGLQANNYEPVGKDTHISCSLVTIKNKLLMYKNQLECNFFYSLFFNL